MTLTELDALKQKRAELQAILATLDAEIRAAEARQKKPVDWKHRALDCIKYHEVPLRTIDILKYETLRDPQIGEADAYKRRLQFQALSVALNSQCDNGTLQRIAIPGFKGYFYGLHIWFTVRGKLKAPKQLQLEHQLWQNPESVFKLI